MLAFNGDENVKRFIGLQTCHPCILLTWPYRRIWPGISFHYISHPWSMMRKIWRKLLYHLNGGVVCVRVSRLSVEKIVIKSVHTYLSQNHAPVQRYGKQNFGYLWSPQNQNKTESLCAHLNEPYGDNHGMKCDLRISLNKYSIFAGARNKLDETSITISTAYRYVVTNILATQKCWSSSLSHGAKQKIEKKGWYNQSFLIKFIVATRKMNVLEEAASKQMDKSHCRNKTSSKFEID